MAYLTIEESGGKKNQIALNRPETVLGRAADVDVCVEADWVSAAHARIIREDQCYFIEDLGSSNGTFVNYERVKRKELEDNDLVFLGRTKMVFRETRAILEESSVELDILSDDSSGIFTKVPEPGEFVRRDIPTPPAVAEVAEFINRHENVVIPDEILNQGENESSANRIESLERALQQSRVDLARVQAESDTQQKRAEQEISRLLDELTTWKSRYFEVIEDKKRRENENEAS